jgi:hypothetical protein
MKTLKNNIKLNPYYSKKNSITSLILSNTHLFKKTSNENEQ